MAISFTDAQLRQIERRLSRTLTSRTDILQARSISDFYYLPTELGGLGLKRALDIQIETKIIFNLQKAMNDEYYLGELIRANMKIVLCKPNGLRSFGFLSSPPLGMVFRIV